MRREKRFAGGLSYLMVVVVSGLMCQGAAAQSVSIFNSGFEMPVISNPLGIVNDPSAADQDAVAGENAWEFTNSSGIAAGGSVFGRVTVPPAPEGNQVGWVDQGGDFSQILNFSTDGSYTLKYQEAGIGIYTVLLDGKPIIASHLATSDFSDISTTFSAKAGFHTMDFIDTDPRDIFGPLPAFVDGVSVSIVPEPASAALIVFAFFAMRRARA